MAEAGGTSLGSGGPRMGLRTGSSSSVESVVEELQTELTRTRSQLALALEELQQLRAASSSQDITRMDQTILRSQLAITRQEPWWRSAWEGFTRGFTLGYGVRAGLSLATKVFSVLRKGRFSDLSSWSLVSETSLVYRVDAIRLGLFCGGYAAVYHTAVYWLGRLGKMDPVSREALAGALAGLCVVFQSEDRRRTMALYTLARVAQCTYNSLKAQGKWHFWGSDWPHGDWLLFGSSTAQIMYAYVMRPETLPTGYWNFVVNAGPIHKKILKAVKLSNEGEAIDVDEVFSYCIDAAQKVGNTVSAPLPLHPDCIPCEVLHPHTSSCMVATLAAGAGTFRKTFPLYMSISLVPYVVFNLKRALNDPTTTMWRALLGAVRSTTFLAAFVSSFQGVVCAQRNLCRQKSDHGLLYMFAGFVASLSLLVEKKNRRGELALYVMPRALDSLFLTLTQDKWVPSIYMGEVALFSACMGLLMHYHNNEPDTMAPLVRSIIGRIVFGPAPDAPRIPLPEIEAARPEEAALPAPAEGQVSSDTEDPVLVSPLRKGQQGVPGALSLEDAEEDAAQASRNWTIV